MKTHILVNYIYISNYTSVFEKDKTYMKKIYNEKYIRSDYGLNLTQINT